MLTAIFDQHVGWGGHSGQLPAQQENLQTIVRSLPAHSKVLEIGFNCGHSSAAMLAARPDLTVVSFDLGTHTYVPSAKAAIDAAFPGRHELIAGDSRETVPHLRGTFELFFIDGGHASDVAAADMQNCLNLARPGDLIAMDDVVSQAEHQAAWTEGPTAAWDAAVRAGRLQILAQSDYAHGRGMGLARVLA
jgi:predicted O-methyltransferase YrrM